MDKQLRNEVRVEVRAAMREALELYNERWVTAEELTKWIGSITPSWMRTYGELLPREQLIVYDENDIPHRTGWSYPLHRLQRMMAEGDLKKLRV